MRTYFAIQGRKARPGGWLECIQVARDMKQASGRPVQIATARAGERLARIVAEVSSAGERLIRDGRTIEAKRLWDGQKETT